MELLPPVAVGAIDATFPLLVPPTAVMVTDAA